MAFLLLLRFSSDDRPVTTWVFAKGDETENEQNESDCIRPWRPIRNGGVRQRRQWDQRIIFTFSGPVEIPGQVLDAGTYVFKLTDSASDRNMVQVFSKNENHLYGTFMTVPD